MARRIVVTVVDDETGDTRKLGEYFMPSSRCKCQVGRRNLSDWGKAKGSGIPICRRCRKASPHWLIGLMPRLEMALGRRIDLHTKG